MSLKVLHVIPSISAVHGGPSSVLRTITKALAADGVEIDVATTNDNGPGFLDVQLGAPVVMDGVTYRFFHRNCRFYTVSWELAEWLDRHCHEYDLVHIHALFSFSSTVAARAARRNGVPYIVRPLGTLNRWGLKNRRPWLKKLSLKLLERGFLENSASVHFTSEQEKVEAMDEVAIEKWIVLPNPVDLEHMTAKADACSLRERYRLSEKRPVVLFLSRLDAKKGLDLLLDAFALLRKQGSDAVLVLSGQGEDKFVGELKSQAKLRGIEDSVIWTGFLQGVEKLQAFQGADVFVLPSYSENFGVSVVEAMSHGLPVIVSDQVAVHREVAEANAGIVVPCGVHELAEALRTLLTEPQLRATTSGNGRDLAKQFSPDVIASRLLSEYQRLLRQSSRLNEPLAC